MRAATTLGVLLALTGCAQAATKTAPDVNKAEAPVARPAVEMTFAGKVPGKPPITTVQLDVTLRNAEKAPRWFVFPAKLPLEAIGAGDGVTGVEVFDASGEGRVVLGKFLGTAGFQAVLVAADGEVSLAKLGIPVWKTGAKGPLAIEVIVASEITVGGQPAAAWFGTASPVSDARASGDASKAKRAASKMTEDRDEVPVVFTEDRRIAIDVVVP